VWVGRKKSSSSSLLNFTGSGLHCKLIVEGGQLGGLPMIIGVCCGIFGICLNCTQFNCKLFSRRGQIDSLHGKSLF
jgi:hypothetical protein